MNQAVRSFELERRSFVSGLFWQPLPGVSPSQRKREMKRIALEQAFDVMVQPSTDVAQVGYATESDGGRAGTVSTAAAMARKVQEENLGRSVLFAGPITPDAEGDWYFFAQREGLILWNGDRIGSQAEVRVLMDAELQDAEWDAVFAPEDWQIRGARERSLSEFVPVQSRLQYQRSKRLRPVRPRVRDLLAYWKPLAALLVLALLTFGAVKVKAYFSARELEHMAEQQRLLDVQRSTVERVPVRTWAQRPRAETFVNLCNEAANNVATFWPVGWTLSGTACGNGVYQAEWKREPSGMYEGVLAVHPGIEVDASGDKALLALRLPSAAGESEALPQKKERLTALRTLASRYGLTLKLQPAVPATTQSGKDKPDWIEAPWVLESAHLPPTQAAIALDGPGFRLEQMESRIDSGVMRWAMRGTQYLRN